MMNSPDGGMMGRHGSCFFFSEIAVRREMISYDGDTAARMEFTSQIARPVLAGI